MEARDLEGCSSLVVMNIGTGLVPDSGLGDGELCILLIPRSSSLQMVHRAVISILDIHSIYPPRLFMWP